MTKRRKQPSAPSKLNTRHPLLDSLVCAVNWGQMHAPLPATSYKKNIFNYGASYAPATSAKAFFDGITIAGGTFNPFGFNDFAGYKNGTSTHVQYDFTNAFQWDQGPFSLFMLVQFHDQAVDHGLWGNGISANPQIWADTIGGALRLGSQTGAATAYGTAGALNNNNRIYSIAFTYESGQLLGYIDGELDLTNNSSFVSNSGLIMGAVNNGGGKVSNATFYMSAIFGRKLEAVEVKALSYNPYDLFEKKIYAIPATAGGATTKTKTTSLDALLSKANNLKTTSLDALLQKTQSLQTSIDAALKQTLVKTTDIDALLSKLGITKTASLDALLQKTLTKTISLDAILQAAAANTITTQFDSLLYKAGLTKTTSIDALLQKTLTKTTSLDSLLQKTLALTTSLDALLQGTLTKTTSLDAVVIGAGTNTITTSLDALLKQTLQLTLSVDALLRKNSNLLTSSFDSVVIKRGLLTSQLDAILSKVGITLTISIDSVLEPSFTVGYKVKLSKENKTLTLGLENKDLSLSDENRQIVLTL